MRAILITCVLLLGFGGIFFYYVNKDEYSTNRNGSPVRAVLMEEGRDVPAGWKEYKNVQYRFSLLVPEALTPTVVSGEEASATIVFADASGEKGFQMFIVQYLEKEVSDERFKKDIPSGVRIDARDATIDGTTAATFESFHEGLGATREVWFIREGLLYEITTLKADEAWLFEILATWKFLES